MAVPCSAGPGRAFPLSAPKRAVLPQKGSPDARRVTQPTGCGKDPTAAVIYEVHMDTEIIKSF